MNLEIGANIHISNKPSVVVGYLGLTPVRYYPDGDYFVYEKRLQGEIYREMYPQIVRFIEQWRLRLKYKFANAKYDNWDDTWELLHSSTEGYIKPIRWSEALVNG